MSSPSKDDASHSSDTTPGIRVICAGLGRTGSMSLTEALAELGYRPYHFVDFNHARQWADLAEGGASVDDVIDLIVREGYDATLDNPCCDIYQDLLRRYPDAKVILTVRDDPNKFVQSWKLIHDTMIITEETFSWKFPCFFGYIPLFKNLKTIRYFMGTTHLNLPRGEFTHGWRDRDRGDAWLAEQYRKHNSHVVDHVRASQLLVFNVKDGWKPLCEFLGKDVPAGTPFPHSTVTAAKALRRMKRMFLAVVYGWIPTLATLAGFTILIASSRVKALPRPSDASFISSKSSRGEL